MIKRAGNADPDPNDFFHGDVGLHQQPVQARHNQLNDIQRLFLGCSQFDPVFRAIPERQIKQIELNIRFSNIHAYAGAGRSIDGQNCNGSAAL